MSRIAPPKDLELTHYRKHVLGREKEKNGEKIWCMVLRANKKTKPNLKPKLYNSLIYFPYSIFWPAGHQIF